MNKKLKLIAAASIIIIATAGIMTFQSCKKESLNTKATPNTSIDNTNSKAIYEKINKFLDMNKSYLSGAKDNGTMTVEEARQNLDLAINYSYSQHSIKSENNDLDTLTIAMPEIDSDGNVSTNDVLAAYNQFGAALASYRNSIDDDRDILSYYSIVMPDNNTRSGEDIRIVFSRGGESGDVENPDHTSEGPFGEGDDFYACCLLGRCNSVFSEQTDAAMQLTNQFLYNNTPPQNGWILVLENTEYVKYISIQYNYNYNRPYVYYEDQNMENCSEHWLFAKEIIGGMGIPCIDHDEMNCYWRSIRRNIAMPYSPLYHSPIYNSPYNQCRIYCTDLYPKSDDNNCTYVHIAEVRYCNAFWIDPNTLEQ